MARNRFSKSRVLKAIKDSNGIVLHVAKRLKTTSRTAKKYIELWEETKDAMREETENVLDIAESKLIDEIKNGELSCVKWYLSKKGRERGYGDENPKDPFYDNGKIEFVFSDKDISPTTLDLMGTGAEN